MILVAATAILILGIAYFQMKQGLFSALLLATWTIISAGLAVTCYEGLASAATIYDMRPDVAEGVALIILFVLPLMLMRFVGDRLVHGDIVFSVMIDRIGGGFFGLVVGVFAVGVLMLVVQMAPLGRAIVGYQPFADDLTRAQRLMPFYPDEVVVGFGEMLSAGSMSGTRTFADHHPNLLLEQFGGRNTAGRGGRVWANPADFLVEGVYVLSEAEANTLMKNLPDYAPWPASQETDIVIVRVKIAPEAANAEDNWWRLPATQFRLLCTDVDERIYDAYPLAYTYWDASAEQKLQLEFQPPDGDAEPAILIVERPTSVMEGGEGEDASMLTVDWVYRLPAGADPKQCWFRRTVGADIDSVTVGFPTALHDDALTTKPPK